MTAAETAMPSESQYPGWLRQEDLYNIKRHDEEVYRNVVRDLVGQFKMSPFWTGFLTDLNS